MARYLLQHASISVSFRVATRIFSTLSTRARATSGTASPTKTPFFSPRGTAAVFQQHGNPLDVVRLEDLPEERLREKQVCVRMLAAPINPSDINRIEGVYPVGPPVPAVGGNEGVGEVIATADDVEGLAVDDWVVPAAGGMGTWRKYIVKEEKAWCKVRKDVPVEYAATALINPCTALRMLEDFVRLNTGDVLVQNGATSIVGQCIIQLAHLRGLQTFNIIRDRPDFQEVKARLQSLGGTDVFSQDMCLLKEADFFAAKVGDKTKLGLNCVGGDAAIAVMRFLGENKTMVTYGGMSKQLVKVPTSALIFKGIELKGFWLQKWIGRHSRDELTAMIDYLLGLVHKGQLKYPMEKVPFSKFRVALEKALGKHGSVPKQILCFT